MPGTFFADEAPAGADWVAVLREVAHAYRRIAREHPRAFPLLATRRFASLPQSGNPSQPGQRS